tara:strand:- start:193 stop:366 length:174 start_codon:yes stop_codon:yes gene_type:complete
MLIKDITIKNKLNVRIGRNLKRIHLLRSVITKHERLSELNVLEQNLLDEFVELNTIV